MYSFISIYICLYIRYYIQIHNTHRERQGSKVLVPVETESPPHRAWAVVKELNLAPRPRHLLSPGTYGWILIYALKQSILNLRGILLSF